MYIPREKLLLELACYLLVPVTILNFIILFLTYYSPPLTPLLSSHQDPSFLHFPSLTSRLELQSLEVLVASGAITD
jgi:hypothetical protein